MYKSFGKDNDLFIDDDKIIGVAVVYKSDDKGELTTEEAVVLLCVDNHQFSLPTPEGSTAREYALKIVSDMNRAKSVLVESSGLTSAKLICTALARG